MTILEGSGVGFLVNYVNHSYLMDDCRYGRYLTSSDKCQGKKVPVSMDIVVVFPAPL